MEGSIGRARARLGARWRVVADGSGMFIWTKRGTLWEFFIFGVLSRKFSNLGVFSENLPHIYMWEPVLQSIFDETNYIILLVWFNSMIHFGCRSCLWAKTLWVQCTFVFFFASAAITYNSTTEPWEIHRVCRSICWKDLDCHVPGLFSTNLVICFFFCFLFLVHTFCSVIFALNAEIIGDDMFDISYW